MHASDSAKPASGQALNRLLIDRLAGAIETVNTNSQPSRQRFAREAAP